MTSLETEMSEIFARDMGDGEAIVLYREEGCPVTQMTDFAKPEHRFILPVGAGHGVGAEHPAGITLLHDDARTLGIPFENEL